MGRQRDRSTRGDKHGTRIPEQVGPGICQPWPHHLRVIHGNSTATNSFPAKSSCSRMFCLQKKMPRIVL